MKVTIKDIARISGFSATTVSLVLNNRPISVSKDTERIIKTTAKELNYQPNHIAKSLVTKKTHTIGLIIPNIGNPFFAELALAVESSLSLAGYNLILSNTNEKHTNDIRYIELLQARGVDGLLIAISPTNNKDEEDKLIQTVNRLDIPVVAIDRWLKGMQCTRVSINHLKGAYIATEHLIKLGHKHIGTITGPLTTYTGRRRLAGYQEALETQGIAFNSNYVVESDYTIAGGTKAAEKLLQQDVSAIFVANDMMALGLLNVARVKGIRVPEDLSIVGFDNLLIGSLIEHPLTTVNQPVDILGESVSKRLLDCINNEVYPKLDIKLEPELIIRSTTKKH